MRAVYRIEVTCLCPVNGGRDRYDAIIEADRMILCEDIDALAAASIDDKAYQEDLCQTWARNLGAKVTMSGWHGMVFVEVTCG